ncbi:Pentatricopeptide repeat-containing protein [Arachis hypogaea]|nr:Pentatricopeptide repeat-containing protein [Arachis hypogaea]
MPHRSVVSWNSMISAYSRGFLMDAAFSLLKDMWALGFEPSSPIFVSILSGCSGSDSDSFSFWWPGMSIHCCLIKLGLVYFQVTLANALMGMYVHFCQMEEARKVFDLMDEKSIISWTTIMGGYVKVGHVAEAFNLFNQMQHQSTGIDFIVFLILISGCILVGDLLLASSVQAFVLKCGCDKEEFIENLLRTMYAKCSDLASARRIFDLIIKKSIFSWTLMIAGYAHSDHPLEALHLFRRLVRTDFRPDPPIDLGSISIAKEMEDYISLNELEFDLQIQTSLIHLYSKCGSIKKAQEVFEEVADKDLTVWSFMINSYAIHGMGKEAIDLFRKMTTTEGIIPDAVVYTSVLLACGNARGCPWKHKCKLGPIAHAYRIHGNVELGELAAVKLLELSPGSSGNYVEIIGRFHTFAAGNQSRVQLANIYKMLEDLNFTLQEGSYAGQAVTMNNDPIMPISSDSYPTIGLEYLSSLSANDGLSGAMRALISEASTVFAHCSSSYIEANMKVESTASELLRADNLKSDLENNKNQFNDTVETLERAVAKLARLEEMKEELEKQIRTTNANIMACRKEQNTTRKRKRDVYMEGKALKAQMDVMKEKVPRLQHEHDLAKENQEEIKAEWSELGEKFKKIVASWTTRPRVFLFSASQLNDKDSLELLSFKALKTNKVDRSYLDILSCVVTYASGLPLALEVMGSNFLGKSIEQWKSALDQYRRIPNKKIQNVIKVSFDGLEEFEKEIFLDIACCFNGCELKDVKRILCAHHNVDSLEYGLKVLVEKSLIKMDAYRGIILHALIQDMGREIVRQESPKKPGKRSRLWLLEDIVQVFEMNIGSDKIEMIHMDFPKFEKYMSLTVINLDHSNVEEIPDISGVPNLELHEDGAKDFVLPSSSIPKWVEHSSNNDSISFWFRNKLPEISLCVLVGPAVDFSCTHICTEFIINSSRGQAEHLESVETSNQLVDHIFITDPKLMKSKVNEVILKNEWNHVVCTIKSCGQRGPAIKKLGIYFHKDRSSMANIQFIDPLLHKEELIMGNFQVNMQQQKYMTSHERRLSLDLPLGMSFSLNDHVSREPNSSVQGPCVDDLCTLRLGLDYIDLPCHASSERDYGSDSTLLSLASNDTANDGDESFGIQVDVSQDNDADDLEMEGFYASLDAETNCSWMLNIAETRLDYLSSLSANDGLSGAMRALISEASTVFAHCSSSYIEANMKVESTASELLRADNLKSDLENNNKKSCGKSWHVWRK